MKGNKFISSSPGILILLFLVSAIQAQAITHSKENALDDFNWLRFSLDYNCTIKGFVDGRGLEMEMVKSVSPEKGR